MGRGIGLTPLTLRMPAASKAGPRWVWTRSERAGEPSESAASATAGRSAARPVSTMLVMAALEGAARHAAASAETAMGGLDILVNNAGVTRDNLFIRMKDEEWDQVLRVNLDSAFYLTRAAVKNMMRRRFGRVIFITSVVGSMGNPGQANYAASKAAISAMAKSVGQEVASRNITLNCIAPGFIQTPMTDVLNEKQTEAMLQRIPAGRYGTPDEVASTAVFLASNEAAYVTGQTVHVNGGMIMI